MNKRAILVGMAISLLAASFGAPVSAAAVMTQPFPFWI